MKKTLMIASGFLAAASLAACKDEPRTPEPAGSSAASGTMPNMPMEMKHGQGVGTVTAIDAAKGMVTLDHDAIAELQWPAMKMDFAAKPELLTGIEVGDKVAFEIDWDGKAGAVTKIAKAGQ